MCSPPQHDAHTPILLLRSRVCRGEREGNEDAKATTRATSGTWASVARVESGTEQSSAKPNKPRSHSEHSRVDGSEEEGTSCNGLNTNSIVINFVIPAHSLALHLPLHSL